VGTLASELAALAPFPSRPRVYADANVPAGLVTYMRERLDWDVLFVVEEDELRRAPDRRHYALARQMERTLITMDRDYLDERRFPAGESGGVVVIWAPNEQLMARTLALVDARVLRAVDGAPIAVPLRGGKLVADPEWAIP